jgi:hypothetical protein
MEEATVEGRTLRVELYRNLGHTGDKVSLIDVAQERGFRFDTVQMPLNVMDAHFRSFSHLVIAVWAADRLIAPFADSISLNSPTSHATSIREHRAMNHIRTAEDRALTGVPGSSGSSDESIGRPSEWREGRYQKPGEPAVESATPPAGEVARALEQKDGQPDIESTAVTRKDYEDLSPPQTEAP